MNTTKPTPNATNVFDSFLDGYVIVPPDKTEFITLDNQRRFYLNASLRKMIGIKAYDRVALAYRPGDKSLALLTGEAAAAISAPTYHVDKRHYMSARRFCADYNYDADKAPYTFAFDRASGASNGVSGIFVFRLVIGS